LAQIFYGAYAPRLGSAVLFHGFGVKSLAVSRVTIG
jgi:hypothetical protein